MPRERIEVSRKGVRHFTGEECAECEGWGGFGITHDNCHAEKCEACDGEGELFTDECGCESCSRFAQQLKAAEDAA